MYYYGYFSNTSLSNNGDGEQYKVVIITNYQDAETEMGGELILSDSPFVVTYESEDSNIYKPYKCSTATVGLLQDDYNFAYSDTRGNSVLVKLLKKKDNTPIKTQDNHLAQDDIYYTIEWVGYATPNCYSQSYENVVDEFELEAQDAISVLQYYDYKTIEEQKGFVSFIQILIKLLENCWKYKNIYITDVLRIPTENDMIDILGSCFISEQNFFDEDNKATKQLEVLEQILLFYNLTLIPFRDSLYIISYDAIKNGNNDYFCYSLKNNSYSLENQKVTLVHSLDIKENHFASNGTKLSMETVFNRMTVKDDLYSYDSVIPDIEDEDKWIETDSACAVGQYDSCNYVMQTPNEIYKPNGNIITNETGDDTFIIDNDRLQNKYQRVWIKYFGWNDDKIGTYQYGNDYKGTDNYWHNGTLLSNINANHTWDYHTMRTTMGAYLVRYACQDEKKTDSNEYIRFEHGNVKDIDFKHAILISLPNEMTLSDMWNSMSNSANPYIDKPMFRFKTDKVAIGPNSKIVISFNMKFYHNSDCLPLNDENYKQNYDFINQGATRMAVRVGDWWYMGNQSDPNKNYPYKYWGDVYANGEYPRLEYRYNSKDDENIFGTEIQFESNIDYKSKISATKGIMIDSPTVNMEDDVIVGDIEVFLYRPFPNSQNSYAKMVLITDFDIKVLTATDKVADDSNTEYSININEDAVEDKDDVSLKISTWDDKETNHSSVYYKYSNTVQDYQFKRLQSIFNKSTGEILRAEEHIINNNLNQYGTPTATLDIVLHEDLNIKPFSILQYHFFENKDFIIDSMEIDYKYNSNNLRIVEKK